MLHSKYNNSEMMLTGEPRIDELMALGLSLEEAIRQYEAENQEAGAKEYEVPIWDKREQEDIFKWASGSALPDDEAENQEAGAVEIDSAAYEQLNTLYPKTGRRNGELIGPNTADRPAVPLVGVPINEQDESTTLLAEIEKQPRIGTEPQFPRIGTSRKNRELPEPPAQAGSNTALRILEVLGGIGGGIFESRAMGKATKATQAAQARANLINTLRGRAVAGVQPTEPKRGILGTLSRGLGAGAKAFRTGREDKATQEQRAFENVIGLTQEERKEEELRIQRYEAETARAKALEEDPPEVGIDPKINAALIVMGPNMVENPYKQFDSIAALNEIQRQFPDSTPGQHQSYLGVVMRGYKNKQRDDRIELANIIEGIDKLKTKLPPERLLDEWERDIAVMDIYVPEDIAKDVSDSIFASAGDVDLGEAAAVKMAGLISIRSGVARIHSKINEPGFEDRLSFLRSNIDALKAAMTPGGRALDPEVKAVMTQIGFNSELLLRTFTGAAAPESEHFRFGVLFIGKLTQGKLNFSAQLKTLDTELRGMQEGIITAAKDPVGGIAPTIFEREAIINALVDKQ